MLLSCIVSDGKIEFNVDTLGIDGIISFTGIKALKSSFFPNIAGSVLAILYWFGTNTKIFQYALLIVWLPFCVEIYKKFTYDEKLDF